MVQENEHLGIETKELQCLMDLFILSSLLSWKNSGEQSELSRSLT